MKKIVVLLAFLSFKLTSALAQNDKVFSPFIKFISKNYKLPDQLKTNCEWMYAIVKVNVDSRNQVTSYSVINNPPGAMSKAFKFMVRYRFPPSTNPKRRSLIFYLSVDNAESCIPKTGEQRFYAPNRVVETMVSYLGKIKQEYPTSIFIPNLIIVEFPKDQE